VLKGAGENKQRLMEVMSTVVIPQKIEVVRNPWPDEISESSGTGTPKRWHMARAHARKLQEGFHRSEDNLRLYLEDLRDGVIIPLNEEDDRAIREGTKCYIHPTERGDIRLGKVVSTRAKIGPGATT